MIKKLVASLAAIAMIFGLAACAGSGKTEVKVGWIPSVNFIAWISAVQALEESENIDIELVEFSSSSAALVALQQGAVDMTTTGYNVFADGLAQSDMPLSYISGISTSGAFFIARDDAEIEDWSDLEGKTLGGSRGSAEYLHMNNSMAANGVVLGEDAEYLNFQNGTDVMLALRNGDIDATVSYEPLISETIAAGGVDVVPALQEDLYSASFEVSSGLLASDSFVADNPEAVDEILGVYTDKVDALQQDPQPAVDIYLSYAAGDRDVISAAADRVTLTYELPADEMLAIGKALTESGQHSEDIGPKLATHLDYSHLEAATGKSASELGGSE